MSHSRQGQHGLHRANSHPNRPVRRTWENMPYPTDTAQQVRSEGESWVEISSQPSSSSLSSFDNEIITTGLRVRPLDLRRHRRATTIGSPSAPRDGPHRSTSSQDEYDESSSEDDNRINSTQDNLHLRRGRLSPRLQMASDIRFPSPSEDDEDDDEDEEGTALGIAEPAFTPQPNPARQSTTPRDGYRESGSYFPPHMQHRPPRFSPTTHRAANDAALRASLTTLLSCAQAARSLPKPVHTTVNPSHGTRNEMQEFRLVPESELLGPASSAPNHTMAPEAQPASRTSPRAHPRSSATASSFDGKDAEGREGKRKSASQSRSAKKKRLASAHVSANGTEVHQVLTQTVSPTLLTWIVSAGVVVFVSVVGFGAGYAMGFEAGKEEGKLIGCGREVPVRVRRFRWGGGIAA